jgi:four helix bundle protein
MTVRQNENPIVEKSYAFALRIIKVCQALAEEKKEWVLSKQLLKSGTSIGANVREAVQGQSKADFISKMSISLKEAHETEYWICLLRDSNFLLQQESNSLLKDVHELIAIITAIVKTSRTK